MLNGSGAKCADAICLTVALWPRPLAEADLSAFHTPKTWIAQCKCVGKGLEALQYLSRYLYRGVISNVNIVDDHGTFRYLDAQTQQWQTRTVTREAFIGLILQHCLPKGFRRARDYGFCMATRKESCAFCSGCFGCDGRSHCRKNDKPALSTLQRGDTCDRHAAPKNQQG